LKLRISYIIWKCFSSCNSFYNFFFTFMFSKNLIFKKITVIFLLMVVPESLRNKLKLTFQVKTTYKKFENDFYVRTHFYVFQKFDCQNNRNCEISCVCLQKKEPNKQYLRCFCWKLSIKFVIEKTVERVEDFELEEELEILKKWWILF